jgi:hypothetical protein
VLDEPVRLHHLSFLPERDEVLIGRRDSESYAVFPPDGAALLQRLGEGMSPTRAGSWYQSTYGEPVDLDDFLSTIESLGFLVGSQIEPGADRQAGQPDEAQVGLQWLGRALFSPVAWLLYLAVFLGWVLVVARHHGLTPHPRQVFFTNSLLLIQLTLIFGQAPCIFLHEAFHVLAGRRLGLSSRLQPNTRLYFVVFETEMNGLLTVPRRQRYLPFLAGMVLDVQLICGLGLLAFATGATGPHPSLLPRLLLAVALPVVPRMGFQFLLFLQTDIYYVFATALGCYDLHAATSALIRNRIHRLLGHPERMVDEGQWSERDRQVARWYAPFAAAGIGVMIALGALVVVPILAHVVTLVAGGLGGGGSGPRFWDTAVSVTFNGLQILLFAAIALRNRARSRRGSAVIATQGSPS